MAISMIEAVVKLPIEEWQKALAVLARAPWGEVNALIMAIGDQVRQQQPRPNGPIEGDFTGNTRQ